ncbi:PREDICTED: uncharacterized protein LOC106809700 [Priapulus caudatus]|uniref:Uncharacterized protein LOC106809700 n=1 Tax=Priapulus caudatus TaxID=37621 RepID=A0ABM1E834_PRICU|nr:PREDICTED: uncharacterized protein LOC106809700 [Priapulus caudatus]
MAMGTVGRGFVLLLLAIVLLLDTAAGLEFQGRPNGYARYPKWTACHNASISFEFKSRQSKALLMYTDDGGTYDFFEVTLHRGKVKLQFHIGSEERKRVARIEGERTVNDGGWHKVEVRRNRHDTLLIVDGHVVARQFLATNFTFGNYDTNSDVYFGGVSGVSPHAFALPSVIYEPPRLNGHIRNVFFSNCSCGAIYRPALVDSDGVATYPLETCERFTAREPCSEGCICISQDREPACDCELMKQCQPGPITHYFLPMDDRDGRHLVNPSGLEAEVFGAPGVIDGVVGNALTLNGKHQWVQIGGREEDLNPCFVDLEKCMDAGDGITFGESLHRGNTFMMWLKLDHGDDDYKIILSNGGHSPQSHGVALLHADQRFEVRYREKNGLEWRAKSGPVSPAWWYHLTWTWNRNEGLSLFINGDLVDRDARPVRRSAGSIQLEQKRTFIIGRASDDTDKRHFGTFAIDNFNFWAVQQPADRIREIGPMYEFYLPMNSIKAGKLEAKGITATPHGGAGLALGKINNGLSLTGNGQYVDLGDTSQTCLSNIDVCHHGLTISTWIYFAQIPTETMHYMSSGENGFSLFCENRMLYAKFSTARQTWTVEWRYPKERQWLYLEMSWDIVDGLQMFVNNEMVSEDQRGEPHDSMADASSHLYIGRDNHEMRPGAYAEAVFDETEMWYGRREALIRLGFILRGTLPVNRFPMDSADGNKLHHPDEMQYKALLYENPKFVRGKISKALKLNGENQYVDFGPQTDSCFGNLDLCHHGSTLTFWVNFSTFRPLQYIISTPSYNVFVNNRGQLTAIYSTGTKTWTVTTSERFTPNRWYLVELSWHADRGLEMFVDTERTDGNTTPTEQITTISDKSVYLGRINRQLGSTKYGAFSIDEMEYWHATRDTLLAFGKIVRGNVSHEVLAMEGVSAGEVVGSSIPAKVHGNPTITPGVIGNALEFGRGSAYGSYVDLGEQSNSWLGNPDLCQQGFTLSLWVMFPRLGRQVEILSGPYWELILDGTRVVANLNTKTKSWSIGSGRLDAHTWYRVDVTWHPDSGLELYVNDRKVDSEVGYTEQPNTAQRRGLLTVGNSRYEELVVDQVQFWKAHRDYLLAFDIVKRGDIGHTSVSMDAGSLSGYTTHGRPDAVAGVIAGAVHFDGRRQYVDLGVLPTCFASGSCSEGFMFTMWAKIENLDGNAYLLSGPYYSLYYAAGRLHAAVNANGRKWEVSAGNVQQNTWHLVDVSWHPVTGLELYVDDVKVAGTADSSEHSRTITDHHTFISRGNSQETFRAYGKGTLDEVQLWNAGRGILTSTGLILRGYVPSQHLPMDVLRGSTMPHPNLTISVTGDARLVTGKKNYALKLSARDSTLNLGNHSESVASVLVGRFPGTANEAVRLYLDGERWTGQVDSD